jgi:catechol 2,3-dioxygenase-like lactoylglutathione lyase family enzyme
MPALENRMPAQRHEKNGVGRGDLVESGNMQTHLRIARPVTNLPRTRELYCAGLGLSVIGSFEDHEGFDGVMLGRAAMQYHFEFTFCRMHPVAPQPTPEDLFVFYVPELDEWERACARMVSAGFKQVASLNPYWDLRGRTFEDHDGYRVVLQQAKWMNQEPDAKSGH